MERERPWEGREEGGRERVGKGGENRGGREGGKKTERSWGGGGENE